MRSLHTHPTRIDAYAGLLLNICTESGPLFSKALDFLFQRPTARLPTVVVTGEKLIDSVAPPKEWQSKKAEWWKVEPGTQRPVALGQNEQNALDPFPLEPDPLKCFDSETRPKPSEEERAIFVTLACALQAVSSHDADLMNTSIGEAAVELGSQAILICVPRFKRTAAYYELPPQVLMGEVLLHELVHLRQTSADNADGLWYNEAQAQWFGFEAALALHQPIGRSFVLRASDLPLPYRLFLRSPKAYEIWLTARHYSKWFELDEALKPGPP